MVNTMTTSHPSLRTSGFTMIELLIVLSVIALLLTIVYPRYFKSIDHTKEAVLKQDLHTLRDSIDKYYGDKGKYPQSLEILVTDKYIRAIPIDPMTGSAGSWVVMGPESSTEKGVFDVRSGANTIGSNGKPYNEW